MFERFTRRAREAVTRAQIVAREADADRIGSVHLLLGVLEMPDTPGARVLGGLGVTTEAVRAAREEQDADDLDVDALRAIGIDIDAVRRRAEERFGPGALSGRSSRPSRSGHIPFDTEAKKALELALREALALKHRHIGTEHVVLGLAREGASGALLSRLAVAADLPMLRRMVLEELGCWHSY